MAVVVHVFEESPVELWGLSSRQRLERVFATAGVSNFSDNLTEVAEDNSVIVIRGDYLYDDRIIKSLLTAPNTILQLSSGTTARPVAAHVPGSLAVEARTILAGKNPADQLPGIETVTPETLTPIYQQQLRKFDPPFVLPIEKSNRHLLEKHLFSWSYKGVTDLVTKWAWPLPARLAVQLCVRRGLSPNQVTMAGLGLVCLAGLLFMFGHYGLGLAAGWLMTFLDTVDGKLARVTVTSSKMGHIFDHAIDLIHPPIWYLLWGLGLTRIYPEITVASLQAIFWLIVIGYLAGRLVEAIFTGLLGRFGIFCWHQIDSYFRLVTGRRNPNLILLTISILLGRPDLGLFWVAFWTVATSLFLVVRLAMAIRVRLTSGPLKPWFADISQDGRRQSLAVRLFTRRLTTFPDGSRG
ncbi:MAG: CDP-alcohol phosphatidyltransferase family protein [Deltaproteobacteria bacterium]|nr:CDP-alcohol phosphatidyltransferase family protein [Candidatus Anaeroferrophillus wilburensis]MBN2887715.1 CDP-alcohol phosphatidyltransferase family protein [Deltaproteobacteria bacterium]